MLHAVADPHAAAAEYSAPPPAVAPLGVAAGPLLFDAADALLPPHAPLVPGGAMLGVACGTVLVPQFPHIFVQATTAASPRVCSAAVPLTAPAAAAPPVGAVRTVGVRALAGHVVAAALLLAGAALLVCAAAAPPHAIPTVSVGAVPTAAGLATPVVVASPVPAAIPPVATAAIAPVAIPPVATAAIAPVVATAPVATAPVATPPVATAPVDATAPVATPPVATVRVATPPVAIPPFATAPFAIPDAVVTPPVGAAAVATPAAAVHLWQCLHVAPTDSICQAPPSPGQSVVARTLAGYRMPGRFGQIADCHRLAVCFRRLCHCQERPWRRTEEGGFSKGETSCVTMPLQITVLVFICFGACWSAAIALQFSTALQIT